MSAEGKSITPVPIVLVAALAENNVIGRDNKLPWRLKSDMQYFRTVTYGRPVVMGRKTYLSIGKALAGRTNIVVSRDPEFSAPGILVTGNLQSALSVAQADAARRNADSIAVIGGTEIFNQTLPMAGRLALTIVHAAPQGDTFFPAIDPAVWREMERRPQEQGPQDDCSFTFVAYERA